MDILLEGTRPMLAIACACALFVMLAMLIDLVSGLYKAKLRGELRTSYGLSRSVSKFILYGGSVMIALMVDIMVHYSRLFVLMKLLPIVGVPVITCLVSVFLCVIEFISIREKAEDKVRKRMDKTLGAIIELIGRERLRDILSERVDSTINSQ